MGQFLRDLVSYNSATFDPNLYNFIGIEEIKRKYSKEAQKAAGEPRTVEQMYDDYKQKVVPDDKVGKDASGADATLQDSGNKSDKVRLVFIYHDLFRRQSKRAAPKSHPAKRTTKSPRFPSRQTQMMTRTCSQRTFLRSSRPRW